MTTENSKELTLGMVKKTVYSWSIRYREAGYTNEQMVRISQEYFEDLRSEGVTGRQFELAVMEARKRCRFFPKMVDILEAVQKVREKPPECKYDQGQLTDTTSGNLTLEEIERNRARVTSITAMLAGRMSMDEALAEVESVNHIKEFKAV